MSVEVVFILPLRKTNQLQDKNKHREALSFGLFKAKTNKISPSSLKGVLATRKTVELLSGLSNHKILEKVLEQK